MMKSLVVFAFPLCSAECFSSFITGPTPLLSEMSRERRLLPQSAPPRPWSIFYNAHDRLCARSFGAAARNFGGVKPKKQKPAFGFCRDFAVFFSVVSVVCAFFRAESCVCSTQLPTPSTLLSPTFGLYFSVFPFSAFTMSIRRCFAGRGQQKPFPVGGGFVGYKCRS